MFYKVLDIPPEVAVRRCFFKVAFIKNLQYSQENTCVGVSFLIKLQALDLQLH